VLLEAESLAQGPAIAIVEERYESTRWARTGGHTNAEAHESLVHRADGAIPEKSGGRENESNHEGRSANGVGYV